MKYLPNFSYNLPLLAFNKLLHVELKITHDNSEMMYTNRGTYSMMFEHKMKEKSNLSFSNKERHTLEYKLYVKASRRNSKRLSTCLDLLLKEMIFIQHMRGNYFTRVLAILSAFLILLTKG